MNALQPVRSTTLAAWRQARHLKGASNGVSLRKKAVAYLTDFGDYDVDHRGWLYNKASLHGVDAFLSKTPSSTN